MGKKLLLSTLVMAGILWAAGYDFHWLKHDVLELANENAAGLTRAPSSNDWGG